jgi:DNA-binding NarL/FixJ family response regulator
MTDEYVRPPAKVADLPPRQLSVAALIARAKTDQQIASELGISDRRVRFHVAALAYSLHLDCSRNVRIQIALWWRDQLPDLRQAS